MSKKFRVWDNYSKMWLDPHLFSIGVDDGKLRNKKNDGIIPNVEISQFTGLLDTNEKEIFEGDILLISYDDDNDEDCQSEVTFENGCFWVEIKEKEYDITPLFFAIEEWDNSGYIFRVIGNIYENKTL